MPKTPKSPGAPRDSLRHNPLTEEYVNPIRPKPAKRQKRIREDTETGTESFLDNKSSRRVLDLGRELAEEAEIENQPQRPTTTNSAFGFERGLEEDAQQDVQYDDDEAWGDEDEEIEVEEVEVDDLATFQKFIGGANDNPIVWPGEEAQPSGGGTDLAALILEKIAAHEAANGADEKEILGGGDPEDAVELPAKVVEVYSKIGLILSRYKSGKLPKPFKILPTIPAWETLLAVTRPENWTPNAVFAATRLFISGKPHVAQEFLNTVLLPRVMEDIQENRKLNVHLYNALKKSLYKPAVFWKAVAFPMLQDPSCTQREATIVASVVAKVSIPVLHSAAALHRICEIAAEQMSSDPESAGPANIFIKILLEKKYALPFKVIDALVFHFLRFRAAGASSADAMDTESVGGDLGGTGKLPVIWHQCLLAFAQHYRNDITEDQREALLDLLLTRGHKSISPEIRRELLEGRGRGVVVEPAPVGMDGDDTMVMAVDA